MPAQIDAAWKSLNAPVGVLERFVTFDREASVIVARTSGGDVRCFDVFENEHKHHILDVTTIVTPTPTDGHPWASRRLLSRATDLATQIATKIDLVGLLCVELFIVGDDVIVNELAPRPHNSGHVTIDACATDQFEQQLRAVCDLPLGDPTCRRPAAMANLLGDLWHDGEPNWAAALTDPAREAPPVRQGGAEAEPQDGPPDGDGGDDRGGARRCTRRARGAIASPPSSGETVEVMGSRFATRGC